MEKIITSSKQITHDEKCHLIEEVRVKEPIWSLNNRDHGNRQAITKSWLEIQSAMRTDEKNFSGLYRFMTNKNF
jgi:hypothetical protein